MSVSAQLAVIVAVLLSPTVAILVIGHEYLVPQTRNRIRTAWQHRRACDECGAKPFAKCMPYCTAEFSGTCYMCGGNCTYESHCLL